MLSEFGRNRLTELTHLELVLFLDGIIEHLETSPGEEKKGEMRTRYNDLTDRLKGTSTREELLDHPYFIIKTGPTVTIHPEQARKIDSRLRQIEDPKYIDATFQKYCLERYSPESTWNKKHQKRVLKMVARKQTKFIQTGDARELKMVTQTEIADGTRLKTTLNPLMRGLSVQLPTRNVVMAKLLMPGSTRQQLISNYLFRRAQSQGHEMTREELGKVLRRDYGIEPLIKKLKKYMASPPICN
jgi:hypothetical protein